MATEAPDTRYARSGAVYIAYQVYGRGPDLVIVPGLFTHLDMVWEQPTVADFYRRLGRFARVIRFDPRGAGLSDRTAELPEFDEQIDDVLAVMDAAGSDRATVLGISQSGPMAILFASSHPEHVLRADPLRRLCQRQAPRRLPVGTERRLDGGVHPAGLRVVG